MTERYVLASKVGELAEWYESWPNDDTNTSNVAARLRALLASAVELPELAEKEKELTVAREYLAHMHNTEECLAKTIAENEELTVTIAALKARCEGMREIIEEIAKDRKGRTPAIYRAMARAAIIQFNLSSLPVEGLGGPHE